MLGPEGHVYDPLPTSTSIRILLLAPGKSDDDVFCFLYPCDLDKDHAIDPSVPRPFESLCVAVASGLDSEDESNRFVIPLDSYIDDSAGDAAPHSDTDLELENFKGKDIVQDPDKIDQSAQNVSGSQMEKDYQSKEIKTTSSPEHSDEQSRESTASEGVERDAESASGEERQLNNIAGESDGNKEKRNKEFDEDMWDLTQLMRLARAGGTLDSRVRRHPFQRYTALSYVWGSVEDPACIIINNAKFWVTKNLLDALKCLRRPDVARALWIDAICMNQDDPDEKKVQIGLMRRVYRQAKKVIAYVPQTLEDTKNFNMLIGKIIRADARCREVIDSGTLPEPQRNIEDSDSLWQAENAVWEERFEATDNAPEIHFKQLPLKPTGTCIEDFDVPAEDDPVWGAWRRFFASPYFRRIWILQEYALPQDLYFQFGWGEGKADHMLLVMHSINERSRLMNAKYMGRGENPELTRAALLGWMGLEQMIYQRIFTRHDLYGGRKLNQRLIDQLQKGMLFDATDPRDKIYALLGLASDAEQFTDLVSYESSHTYTKIYRRFAERLIEQGHLMQILQMSCRTHSNPQLPSWVPDWSTPTEKSLMPGISLEKDFHAGGNKDSIRTHFSKQDQGQDQDQNQDQLVVSGHIFSTIAFKTSAFVPHSPNAPFTTGTGRLQDLFEVVMAVISELSSHIGQVPVMDIFHILTMQVRRIESVDGENPDRNELFDDLRLFRTFMARIMQYSQIEGHAEHKVVFGAMPEEDRDFMQKVARNVAGRSFCIVKDENRVGLVPEQAQVGDSLAIFDGAPVPFVLQEATENAAETGKTYRVIGDAYVTGVMQGELVQENKDAGKQIMLV